MMKLTVAYIKICCWSSDKMCGPSTIPMMIIQAQKNKTNWKFLLMVESLKIPAMNWGKDAVGSPLFAFGEKIIIK